MGIFDWLSGKSKQPKKEEVKQYKIDDDMPASIDTTIKGREMFKKDMTGLLAYFEERPDMERLYNEFTHLIRNGHSVNEYLNGANVMDDLEVRSAVKKGFGDIAGFLRDMLKIQENEELRKDFNACVEATTVLKVKSSEAEDYFQESDETDLGKQYHDFDEMILNADSLIEEYEFIKLLRKKLKKGELLIKDVRSYIKTHHKKYDGGIIMYKVELYNQLEHILSVFLKDWEKKKETNFKGFIDIEQYHSLSQKIVTELRDLIEEKIIELGK